MINKFNNIFIYLFLFVPLFLITGPALPDIIITFSSIYFLLYFILIKKNYFIFKENLFLISIFFWLILILISFFAVDRVESFQDSIIFIRFLLIPIVGYYFLLDKQKNIKKLIYILFILVCFVMIDSMFQFLNYSSEYGFGNDLLGFKSEWYGRLTGPFGDELVPGVFISRFGLIGYLIFFYIKENKINFYLEIIYLSSIGIVCFATGERMALATYFLALLFLFIFFKGKRNIFILSIILSILIIFIINKNHPFYNDYKVLSSSEYHQGLVVEKSYKCKEGSNEICNKLIKLQPNFLVVLKNFDTSAYGEIYNLAFKMFMQNPLTGVGISNYQSACLNIPKFKKEMKNYDCASHPHNIYVQWLSEGGLITLTTFLFYLYIIFYTIQKKQNKLKYISLAILLIIFWPIMSTGSLIKNWNGVFSFYIITISIVLTNLQVRKNNIDVLQKNSSN